MVISASLSQYGSLSPKNFIREKKNCVVENLNTTGRIDLRDQHHITLKNFYIHQYKINPTQSN